MDKCSRRGVSNTLVQFSNFFANEKDQSVFLSFCENFILKVVLIYILEINDFLFSLEFKTPWFHFRISLSMNKTRVVFCLSVKISILKVVLIYILEINDFLFSAEFQTPWFHFLFSL